MGPGDFRRQSIVLVNVADTEEIEIVAEAVRAHEYWRFKGLNIDLVILNSEGGGYLEPVRDLIPGCGPA